MSTITLTALVSRKKVAERSAVRPAGTPRDLSTQAPMARLPAPPKERAAPKAISVQARRAAKRRGARANTSWKAST